MTTDSLSRLHSAKEKADKGQLSRRNFEAYVTSMTEFGWSEADVAEYKAEVERIMRSGTDDEKAAAREFWAEKASGNPAVGVNQRISRSIADEKRKAA